MPAATLIRFFAAHGLLRLSDRPRWRTVTGGSRSYVARIADVLARNGARVTTGRPVVALRRAAGEAVLSFVGGQSRGFDHVVLAVHGDQALRLLADASVAEQAVLGAFSYRRNRVVLHRDAALMPVRRRAWAAWNYLSPDGPEGPQGVTCWVNRLQNIDSEKPLFVTLNPPFDPAPGSILGEFDYAHPVFDQAAIRAQRRLGDLPGVRRTWFCGSYFGYGFHEDAFASGVAVACALGAAPPWEETPSEPRLAAQ